MIRTAIKMILVLYVVWLGIGKSVATAQWDPTNSDAKINWSWLNPLDSSSSPEEARDFLLSNPVPERLLTKEPLLSKLYSKSWDMYRNPGRREEMYGFLRDPNQKEFTFSFGYANDFSQKMKIFAVAVSVADFFFTVESAEVKELAQPWNAGAVVFPKGTRMIVMKLSDIESQYLAQDLSLETVHTWNLMLGEYKDGWTGKLVDTYHVELDDPPQYRGYVPFDESVLPRASLECPDGYGKAHIVFLRPSEVHSPRDRKPGTDDTGIADPEF